MKEWTTVESSVYCTTFNRAKQTFFPVVLNLMLVMNELKSQKAKIVVGSLVFMDYNFVTIENVGVMCDLCIMAVS